MDKAEAVNKVRQYGFLEDIQKSGIEIGGFD